MKAHAMNNDQYIPNVRFAELTPTKVQPRLARKEPEPITKVRGREPLSGAKVTEEEPLSVSDRYLRLVCAREGKSWKAVKALEKALDRLAQLRQKKISPEDLQHRQEVERARVQAMNAKNRSTVRTLRIDKDFVGWGFGTQVNPALSSKGQHNIFNDQPWRRLRGSR